jgi:hypothetical protein
LKSLGSVTASFVGALMTNTNCFLHFLLFVSKTAELKGTALLLGSLSFFGQNSNLRLTSDGVCEVEHRVDVLDDIPKTIYKLF